MRGAYWLKFGGLAGLYAVIAAILPLADDEAYYWCWAQNLQLSYFDHPPMVAYFMRLATSILGHSVLALRLPACLAMAGVALVIADLTRSRRLMLWILLTPLFTFGAILHTPDTPLLLFWSLYLRWLVGVQRRLTPAAGGVEAVPAWMWGVGGVLLGAGALAKYTMALAVPAGFLTFCLAGKPVRRWLVGYLAHGLVALLMFTPVLAYNLPRSFEPLWFQWHHAMAKATTARLPFLTAGEFLLVQMLLFGTWPVILYPWVLKRFRTLSLDPTLRACVCLYAVPFGFFVAKSFRGPLEGNWAMVSYISFWPVAAVWLESVCPVRQSNRALRVGFLAPLIVTVGVFWHVIWPLTIFPPKIDRLCRQKLRLEVAAQVAEVVKAAGDTPVYTPTYQWVALLRYHGVDARQMAGVSRPSHFTTKPAHLSDEQVAFVWNETPLPEQLCAEFQSPELIARYPMRIRGVQVTEMQLFRYSRSECPGEFERQP